MNKIKNAVNLLKHLSEYLRTGSSFETTFPEAVKDMQPGKSKRFLEENISKIKTPDDFVGVINKSHKLFPDSFPQLLEKAAESKDFNHNIKYMTAYYENVANFRKQIKNLLLYFWGLLTVLSFALFAAREALMVFEKIYYDINIDLPYYTQFFITISKNLSSPFFWSILILIMGILLYIISVKNDKAVSVLHMLRIFDPVTSKILSHFHTQNFLSLLKLGFPIKEIPVILMKDENLIREREALSEIIRLMKEKLHRLPSVKSRNVFPKDILDLIKNEGDRDIIRKRLEDFLDIRRSEIKSMKNKWDQAFTPVITILAVIGLIVFILAAFLPFRQLFGSIGI